MRVYYSSRVSKALVERLIYNTGMQQSELLTLTVQSSNHIDLKNLTLKLLFAFLYMTPEEQQVYYQR